MKLSTETQVALAKISLLETRGCLSNNPSNDTSQATTAKPPTSHITPPRPECWRGRFLNPLSVQDNVLAKKNTINDQMMTDWMHLL
jgi:hypothetical protein